jgi:hypothetical protein
MVTVDVDPELANIIEEMRKDPMTDKAIRNYARAFIGTGDKDWTEKYRERY